MSDGTTYDIKGVPDSVDKMDLIEMDIVCADKGYDPDALPAHIEQVGTRDNTPRKQTNLMH